MPISLSIANSSTSSQAQNVYKTAAFPPRPDAIENSFTALVSLPRYETIRQDLEKVVEHNLEIERITRVVDEIMKGLQVPLSGGNPEEWLKQTYDDTIREYGSGYLTYQRLKLSSVTDELAELVARAFEIDLKSSYASAIRILAGLW